MRTKRRIISILLCGAVMLSLCSPSGFGIAQASEDSGQITVANGLCEHHTEHTEACGYAEGEPGTPCAHEHTQDCCSELIRCVHEHDESCYPDEEPPDDEVSPADAGERVPSACTHECSRESGCITEELNCAHEHDGECGYTPAAEGTPCGYVCGICGAENPADETPAEETPADETPADETPAEENPADETPAEVKAFLDAVAGIPEITPDNAAEAAEYIYGPVTEAYQALLDTDFMDRDDVKAAEAVYAAAIEAVDAALDMESETFGSPAKPTDDTLKALKLGVKIVCDMEGRGHHAELGSTLTTLPKDDAKTISEVTANTGDNKDQYPYTCTVSITVAQQKNFWLNRYKKQVCEDVQHKLPDGAQELSVTLYWDKNTRAWTDLDTSGQWHYMEIHMRHVLDTYGLELSAQINGIEPIRRRYDHWNVSLPGLANGAELNYTLTVTNNTNVNLKDLLICDRRDNADKVKLVEGSARVTVNGVERGFTCTKTGTEGAYSAYYYWKIEGGLEVGDKVVLTYKAVMPHEGGGQSYCSANNYVQLFAKLADAADMDVDFLSNSNNSWNWPPSPPDGYTQGNAIASYEIEIRTTAQYIKKPTVEDIQQVSVVIRCKDNYKHDSGIDWWKLGYTLDGTDKVYWRDTWRSIGNVTYNGDGTYQSIVTFYATKWADMRINGTTLTNVKKETGIEHVYYGTTVEDGDDKAAPGGEGLETVPVKFTYKDGKWTTDTKSVTVWLKENANTVTLRYMCDASNAPFSSGNYSYGLGVGKDFNHSVDSSKTGYPQVKDFNKEYRSPKSFKTSPTSANTWVYDEIMTTDALTGSMGGENIAIDVWYSKDNKGSITQNGADGPDGIPDKYQAKVTFKVVNGTWNNGSTADVVKYVTKYAADGKTMAKDGTATLNGPIPTVGSKPDTGCEAGSWNTEPKAGATIDKDTVYTYTYKKAGGDDTSEKHTVTVKYMCGESNTTFSSADYSYKLAKGEKYNHSVDNNKTDFPNVNDFNKDYTSPKSFRISSTWVYDAAKTDAAKLTGTMGDEDIVIEVWYSRKNEGDDGKGEEKPAKYTVTFNSNGGSPVAAQTVEDGKTAFRPAAPTREGYTFSGWTLNGVTYGFTESVTGDITLEAQWSRNSGGGGGGGGGGGSKPNPPVDPPVNPPVNPPVDPPVDPPVNPPVDPPVNPPVTPPETPPVTPSVNPPENPPVTPQAEQENLTTPENPTTLNSPEEQAIPVNPTAQPIPDSPYGYPTYRNEMPDPNDPDSPDIIVVINKDDIPAPYVKTVDPEKQDNMIYIEDPSIPLAGPAKTGSWALVNLILSILTVLASLILIILYFGRKRKDEKEEEDENLDEEQQAVRRVNMERDGEEEPEEEIKKKFWLRLASIVIAVISVVLFVLTEDMRLPMTFVDRWTLWMAVIAVVQLVVCLLSKKRSEEQDDDSKSEEKSRTTTGASC